MNRIEMIWYCLMIIGMTLMSTGGLFFTLSSMVKGHKIRVWIFGIFTSIFVVILVRITLVPPDPFLVWKAEMAFILGLTQLCGIMVVSVDKMRDLQN